MIEIVPDVLEYKPPFTTSSTEYVTITNKSSDTVAFKVKTTAPKIYCVRPNAAVVAPGEQVQIQVILLGLSEEPAPDFKCKDKFLLITLPAPYELGDSTVAEVWPQLEAEFKQQAVSKKIKVKYLINTQSGKAPVDDLVAEEEPGDVSQNASMNKVNEKAAPVFATTSDDDVPSVNAEKKSSGNTFSLFQDGAPIFNPALVLLAALLALVLGWLYY
ncbi:phospholipid metabolism-regulating protein SCS22 Ecym_7130 [Eremothecium cymbalariae DBVPG|uniref:MSP domain-containing protein n=1 Tax=Eremothecium cymbalariae (strain CBS 270.75 / DBVPG 7215 / KCTC 17166 / NRRL Y-17582) TaxID=931890 RepID=G8JVW5_ERECY|nr:hypothetical protein Ecym_7130 [Eremothecium cymbalariae DBVPG\